MSHDERLAIRMSQQGRRILYIDGYTSSADTSAPPSSDSIGYGITASRVIRCELETMGYEIARSSSYMPRRKPRSAIPTRSQWIFDAYSAVLKCVSTDAPDLIFFFHAFQAFPTEVLRTLFDLELRVPLMGYTHGSHWDYTDLFRRDRYPGLEFADLANLCAMDRVFVTSRYMKQTLHENINAFNSDLAAVIDDKVRIVGLPIDIRAIEASRTTQRFPRTSIVYNHAPIASKDPALFLEAITEVLRSREVDVLFTRRLPSHGPVRAHALALGSQYPGRLHFGDDLSIDDYYQWLWMADIQVSTAFHESLGISTLEAMYTRNCCILPRIGSYPELCDGDEEVLYDRSAAQLIDRLCFMIDSGKRRNELGARMRKLACRYAPNRVARSIDSAIAELLVPEHGQR
jgi:glycosyltransferase involved in cell wall biosynthesis